MFNTLLKNLSILKKFLFINLIIFIIIGSFTIIYLSSVKPNLIKKKTSNHIQIINNTIDHIQRLKIKFNEEDIRKFLFSTRFLFQNLDRVILFDIKYKLVGDTDTLDLDPRSFSQKLNIVEHKTLEEKNITDLKERENYFWDNHGELMNKYPFLISQLCSSNDDSMLDFMMQQLKNMDSGSSTKEDTDVVVGQKIANTYIKPVVDKLENKE